MITCGNCSMPAHTLTHYYQDDTSYTTVYCTCSIQYPDVFRFPFGKHAKKTILEVIQTDPSYLSWAVKNMTRKEVVASINKFMTPYRIIWD